MQEFLATAVLDITKHGELMAEDFRFVAPVVGPLSKKEFLSAFGGFNILVRIRCCCCHRGVVHFQLMSWRPWCHSVQT